MDMSNESGGVGVDELNGEVKWWLEEIEKEIVHRDWCESAGRERKEQHRRGKQIGRIHIRSEGPFA